jgi:hypothetical protein
MITGELKFSDYLARKITNETFDIEINNETVSISLDSNSEGYIARRLREIIR